MIIKDIEFDRSDDSEIKGIPLAKIHGKFCENTFANKQNIPYKNLSLN